MFWESNPTNIESLVFLGNTAITLITQKTLRDPILPLFSPCLSVVGVWGDLDAKGLGIGPAVLPSRLHHASQCQGSSDDQ